MMGMGNMSDMGEMKKMPTMEGEEPKQEKAYPRTTMSSKKLPGINSYDVGDMIELHSVNKIVGKRENEDGEIEAEMDMMKCGIMKGGKIEPSEEEYKNMPDEEKDKVDEEEVMGEH